MSKAFQTVARGRGSETSEHPWIADPCDLLYPKRGARCSRRREEPPFWHPFRVQVITGLFQGHGLAKLARPLATFCYAFSMALDGWSGPPKGHRLAKLARPLTTFCCAFGMVLGRRYGLAKKSQTALFLKRRWDGRACFLTSPIRDCRPAAGSVCRRHKRR